MNSRRDSTPLPYRRNSPVICYLRSSGVEVLATPDNPSTCGSLTWLAWYFCGRVRARAALRPDYGVIKPAKRSENDHRVCSSTVGRSTMHTGILQIIATVYTGLGRNIGLAAGVLTSRTGCRLKQRSKHKCGLACAGHARQRNSPQH
jgi:hypothetical protein